MKPLGPRSVKMLICEPNCVDKNEIDVEDQMKQNFAANKRTFLFHAALFVVVVSRCLWQWWMWFAVMIWFCVDLAIWRRTSRSTLRATAPKGRTSATEIPAELRPRRKMMPSSYERQDDGHPTLFLSPLLLFLATPKILVKHSVHGSSEACWDLSRFQL